MDKILIFDNFLEAFEIEEIIKIIKENKWDWGHTSNGVNKYETPFWSMTLNDFEFLSKYIKKIIEKTVGKNLNLLTVYANGQTFGQDGTFHTDYDEPNYYTFCLYVSNIEKNYVDIAGGYINFKLPDTKAIICFEPLFNRGIFFPSNYIHKSTSFYRYIMDLRIVVSWKFIECI